LPLKINIFFNPRKVKVEGRMLIDKSRMARCEGQTNKNQMLLSKDAKQQYAGDCVTENVFLFL